MKVPSMCRGKETGSFELRTRLGDGERLRAWGRENKSRRDRCGSGASHCSNCPLLLRYAGRPRVCLPLFNAYFLLVYIYISVVFDVLCRSKPRMFVFVFVGHIVCFCVCVSIECLPCDLMEQLAPLGWRRTWGGMPREMYSFFFVAVAVLYLMFTSLKALRRELVSGEKEFYV